VTGGGKWGTKTLDHRGQGARISTNGHHLLRNGVRPARGGTAVGVDLGI